MSVQAVLEFMAFLLVSGLSPSSIIVSSTAWLWPPITLVILHHLILALLQMESTQTNAILGNGLVW